MHIVLIREVEAKEFDLVRGYKFSTTTCVMKIKTKEQGGKVPQKGGKADRMNQHHFTASSHMTGIGELPERRNGK